VIQAVAGSSPVVLPARVTRDGMGAVCKTVASARLVRFQRLAPRAYGPEDRTPAPEAGYAGSSPAGRTLRLIVQGTARLRPKEQAGVRIVLSRLDAHAGSCLLSLTRGSQVRRKSTAADEPGEESWQPSGTEVIEARPAWLDGDAHHLVIHRPDLLLELSALLRVQRLRSTLEVFIGDAVDRLQHGLAATLQRLRVFQTHCPRRWSARRLAGFPVPGPSGRTQQCQCPGSPKLVVQLLRFHHRI
jgi:hypothetical protein